MSQITFEQASKKIQDLCARIEEVLDELEWYRNNQEKHRQLVNELARLITELGIWSIIFGVLLVGELKR